jgi:hypothetical protein
MAAYGLGSRILGGLSSLSLFDRMERWPFAFALGLGAISNAVMILGIIGALTPLGIAVILGIGLGVGHAHWERLLLAMPNLPRSLTGWWSQRSFMTRAAAVAVGIILLSSALHTLTPPWSFDALMYHLTAPREYLEAARIFLIPDLWQANGPMGIEMLYAIGLAFGSASVARVTHLFLTALLVMAAYTFAARHLDRAVAGLAVLLLASIPIFPIWGNIANIDSGWALFEFLSVYAAITWVLSRDRPWLLVSGAMVGLALSSKYLGLAGAATSGLLIIAGCLSGPRRDLRPVLSFSLVALAIGLPWYLLNVIRAGNPIYPFAFGGPEWDQDRLGYLMTYLRSFGAENKTLSLALAPIWLYTRRELYTTFMSGIEFPSFLFPLSLVLPFVRAPRPLRWMGAATLLRFLLWGIGSQQTRFLLPIFPSLAVVTAFVIQRFLNVENFDRRCGWRSFGNRSCVSIRVLAHGPPRRSALWISIKGLVPAQELDHFPGARVLSGQFFARGARLASLGRSRLLLRRPLCH